MYGRQAVPTKFDLVLTMKTFFELGFYEMISVVTSLDTWSPLGRALLL